MDPTSPGRARIVIPRNDVVVRKRHTCVAVLVALLALFASSAFADDAGTPAGEAADAATAPAPGAGLQAPGPAPDAGVPATSPTPAITTTPPSAPSKAPAPSAGPGARSHVAPPPAHVELSSKDKTLLAIKVIGGLVALFVLAFLGGSRPVVRMQERLGVTNVIAAGFPFVALGLIASHPRIGVLDGKVLSELRPILHFGLGWLGFIIGAQLDIRVLDKVPKGTAYIVLVEAIGPFAAAAGACGAVMVGFGASWKDPSLWRDLIVLGAAAAMTAPRQFRGFAMRSWREGKGVDVLLGQLDEIVGVIGLLFLTAYFRGDMQGSWQLPPTAWIFVSIGLGVVIGVLIFAMIRVPHSNAEFLAVVLGSIAFASGLAGYLGLSPIVVCFLAGVLVINFPNDQKDSVFRILNQLERPIQQLFLIVAGAVWSVYDWRGWVLVPLFVAARAIGKWLGVTAAHASLASDAPVGFTEGRTLVSPLSSLSIALVISIESLYADAALAWVTTAVIGGAVVTEILVQFLYKDEPVRAASVAVSDPVSPGALPMDDEVEAAIDELEEVSGPVYRDDELPAGGRAPGTEGGDA
jgi:Kef-type K+ transport system membrane component KefB